METTTEQGGVPKLLDLPVDIRRIIYSYLFSHPNPIWIGTKYRGLVKSEDSEPTFHTQFFRVSRKAYHDSISFAYGENQFVLKDTFNAFSSISPVALAALKDLTIVHSSWTDENALESEAWECLRTQCSSLRHLEVQLHSDLLFQSIRHLANFFASISPDQTRPILTLDLYVWARHNTFDPPELEFRHSFDMLCGRYKKSRTTPHFVNPKERVLRLPQKAREIVLSADVIAGTVQALDAYLLDAPEMLLVKTREELPKTGIRSYGRSERLKYTWTDAAWPAGFRRSTRT